MSHANNDSSSIYYGDPGVGYFGLMDYGSNNGRGVIPAPPTPWTRIKVGWSDAQVIDPYDGLDTIITISALDIAHQVYQIKIAEDEYFLLENRQQRGNYGAPAGVEGRFLNSEYQ